MSDAVKSRSVLDYDTEDALRKALLAVELNKEYPENDSNEYENQQHHHHHHQPNQSLDWVLPCYDPETTEIQSMKQELRRLQVLKSYVVLDSDREQSFERITAIAARVYDVPIALVSLVDLGRQWFLSNRGLGDCRETPRRLAFCAHAVCAKQNECLIVPDATRDFRFQDNPLVTGPPNIRFYAGAPLISPEGFKLGTLCIISDQVRPDGLSADEQQTLLDMAEQVVEAMVHRRRELQRQEKPEQLIAYTAHDLMTPLTGVQLSLGLLKHDDDVQRYLSGHHMELLTTASTCSDLMIRICRSAMESLNNKDEGLKPHDELFDPSDNDNVPVTKMDELVKSLTFIMEPIPKHVPLVIRLDQAVPPMILSDDLKLFRSALNFLSVAAGRTKEGGIQLRIFSRRGNTELVFECEDTGDDIPLEEYQHLYQQSRPEDGNLRMSLSSVASLISSIDGEYGFRPRVDRATLTSNNSPSRYQTGSVFWFSVPLFMPEILRVPTVGSMGDLSRTKQARRMSEPMSSGLKEPILKGLPAFLHHSASKANSVNSLGRQCMEGVVVTSGQANAAFDDVFQKVFHPSGEGITADTNMITIPETVELNGDRDVDGDRKMSTAHVDPYPVVENHHAQQARIHRALVIDDSLVIRKSLSMALSKHGFDVRQAADGLEGLNMMKESLFDIVLCDFLMPVMDGLDCVKQYRDWELKHRSYFEQRIIGVSAHANNVVSQQGLAAGMEAFYPKPVSIGTIKEIVESHESYERSKQLDHLMCDILQHIKQANVGYGVDRSSNRGQEPQGSRKRDSEDERSSDDESDPMEVKRPRRIAKEDTGANSKQRVCLVATDRPTKLSNEIVPRLESNNWQVVVVHSGSDALRLLKMRNWDLILMDDFLPETPGDMCVAQFRSWEADSRVNRQKNVFLVTEFDVPAPYDKTAIVQPPNGFDGVVHKPIAWRDIKYLLATNDLLKDSMTIVVGGACK